MVFQWDGKTVFVDPVGGTAPFNQFGTPDVLVTDILATISTRTPSRL